MHWDVIKPIIALRHFALGCFIKPIIARGREAPECYNWLNDIPVHIYPVNVLSGGV